MNTHVTSDQIILVHCVYQRVLAIVQVGVDFSLRFVDGGYVQVFRISILLSVTFYQIAVLCQ